MTEKTKIQARDEPFTGIVCHRVVLPSVVNAYTGRAARTVILGIIEDLEEQPENPIVYLFSFECSFQQSDCRSRDAYASLRIGHKVRVCSTEVSPEGLPYTDDIVVDTSQFAKEFLATLKKDRG